MNDQTAVQCPECWEFVPPSVDRRRFLRNTFSGVALAGLAGSLPQVAAAEAKATANKTAEQLILELFGTLTAEQKKSVVLPMSDKGRTGTYNAAYQGVEKGSIGKIYTKPQIELIDKIFKSMIGPGEETLKRMTRGGTWDASKAFENTGFHMFGDVAEGKQFTGLITGHHLTLRCDTNLKDDVAWGGPVYYGHTPNGYAEANVFLFQTKSAMNVYKALDAKQKKTAVSTVKNPGDGAAGIKMGKKDAPKPGIPLSELNKEQTALLDILMKDVLSLFRKEDADEVLGLVKKNGGQEKINLAFYRDEELMAEDERYHFWRLEGPGFIWNYRVLPHVHCFVNITNS